MHPDRLTGNGDEERAVRRSFRVTGVVQGVGFRPFVYVLATSLELTGHVGNDSGGVFVEVEGAPGAVAEFTRRISADAPPLARVEAVTAADLEASGTTTFEIVASAHREGALTLVAPDMAPCDACLSEMRDPSDRRFGYPFLNCTNCGPRFTITRDVPYDRPLTTMAGFPMCDDCRAEYENPTDRRFHAQPTACPRCGPKVWTEPATPGDPIEAVRRAVHDGAIVAIKGVGGFHLACRSDIDDPVETLRRRKGRVDKPFAVMAADLDTAHRIAVLDAAEAALLAGPERPIVLVRKRPGGPLSPSVAPGNGYVGVMLPSSPLHELLLAGGECWVMTSGNRSQEPICVDNDEAAARLADLADLRLVHDRPIHVPCDDSVVRVVGEPSDRHLLPVRRSRGYAPYPVDVAFGGPPVLAVGGELKATFCLTTGSHAFMSQHIGDMENLETLDTFQRAVEHMTALFRTTAEVLAVDMHPRYLSARWAEQNADGRPIVRVQHHHAHLAALLAEHRRSGPILGFSFDGTGYGTDHTPWGGEVMIADLAGFERVGHLAPSMMAGGDMAVRRPHRQALARMRQAGVPWTPGLPPVDAVTTEELRILATQIDRGINAVSTTSMGRLFDAVASMAGVRQTITYEGQAAIEFEALCDPDGRPPAYRIDIDDDGVWQTARLVEAVVADVAANVEPGAISWRFHAAVADAVLLAAARLRGQHGPMPVGLSGGVFQNVTLTGMIRERLLPAGFEVLTHRVVPPNDGGIALGQAAVAAVSTV